MSRTDIRLWVGIIVMSILVLYTIYSIIRNPRMVPLAWKNLTNKPLTMLLSLVLFALGVGMISLLLLINTQVQDKFEKNLAGIDVVLGAKGSPLQLILCSMYHVDAPTGNISIKEVRPFLNPKHPLFEMAVPLSIGDSYRSRRIIGTTHDFPKLYNAEIGTGRLWEKNLEATIGAEVAKSANLKIGDKFFSSHGFMSDGINEHEHGEFTVVGIFKPSGSVVDQLILANSQSIWEVHKHEGAQVIDEEDEHSHDDHDHSDHDHDGHNHDHDDHSHDGHDHANEAENNKPLMDYVDEDITSLLLKFKSKTSPAALNMARSINENTDLQAASPAIEMNRLYDNMSLGEEFLRTIALIIVFVSGLSVFISLFNSLRERKYELSLMRVMGASPGKLFTLIILEGLLLAILGYVIGIALSHLGMWILAGYMQDEFQYSFTASMFLKEELYLLGAALGVGFLASIIPAIQAFRTDISQTLTEA